MARQLLALRRASWSRSRQLPGAERTLTPRSFDDDPAMGFNKRKMEDRRRKAAEHEAVARRALGPQIIEDLKLIEAWNARQAAHMPMLFSPTIEAAITAGYWFLRARCPACRTTGGVWPFWAVWTRCHKNIAHASSSTTNILRAVLGQTRRSLAAPLDADLEAHSARVTGHDGGSSTPTPPHTLPGAPYRLPRESARIGRLN